MVSVCQNELGNILQERILIHIFLECIDPFLIHAISRDAIIEQQSQFLIGQLRLDKIQITNGNILLFFTSPMMNDKSYQIMNITEEETCITALTLHIFIISMT